MRKRKIPLQKNCVKDFHVRIIIIRYQVILFGIIRIFLKNFLTAEFCEYINYTRALGFEADPDYNYLRDLFKRIMQRNNDESDFVFDWSKKKKSVPDSNSTHFYR